MATKWGVVSAGKICHDFVTATQSIPGEEHKFIAVAARSLESAKLFARNHDIPQAYGSYEELAKDPDIEVVYIGTININHFSIGKLMLESGKHVLMEKPMTLNLKQTKSLIEIARKHKRFLMEAIWSRFTPVYREIVCHIKNGSIGELVHVSANFGIPLLQNERVIAKELGGSAVLDIGIYTIHAVCTAFNNEKPKKVAAVGHLNEEGVDISMTGSLLYSKNRTASITCNAITDFPCDLIIIGTKGNIKISKNFWCPTNYELNGEIHELPLPETVRPCNYVNSSALRFEAMEVRECLKKGILESAVLPLKDSVTIAETMDEIRHQLGVQFLDD